MMTSRIPVLAKISETTPTPANHQPASGEGLSQRPIHNGCVRLGLPPSAPKDNAVTNQVCSSISTLSPPPLNWIARLNLVPREMTLG